MTYRNTVWEIKSDWFFKQILIANYTLPSH